MLHTSHNFVRQMKQKTPISMFLNNKELSSQRKYYKQQ
jgi:hypothetical protein